MIAKTEKGHGVKAVANQNGRHGKPLDDPEAAIAELGGMRDIHVDVAKPEGDGEPHRFPTTDLVLPSYEPGTKEATRKAFGDALVALGRARGEVVAIDGEVGNSTYTELFANELPDRFFQAYIAEQQMVATAVGFQVRGWKPFAAHLRRLPEPRLRLHPHGCRQPRQHLARGLPRRGQHRRGRPVADGARGPGRLPRGPWRTVLYPSDPNQTAALVAADGGPRGDRLHAHHPREDADPLSAG